MKTLDDQKFIVLLQDDPEMPWRPRVFSEAELSKFFEHQYYVGDDPYPIQIKWASESGDLFSVEIEWTTTPYDEDDYAHTTGVLKAAGMRVVGHIGFRIDGRD